MTLPGPSVAGEVCSLIRPFDVCKPLKLLNPHIVVLLEWDEKDVILKNKPEKLLKTQGKATLIAKNKPENKAEKLLKTHSCGKN